MFGYNKTVVEFDLVQHQISFVWSSDVRLSFASPSITCHGKTNLMLDEVSSNNCLLYSICCSSQSLTLGNNNIVYGTAVIPTSDLLCKKDLMC